MKGRTAAGGNLVAFETEMQLGMKFNSYASHFRLFSRRLNYTSVQYKANTTTEIKHKNITDKQKQIIIT
jgi:hypothetical protein